MTQKKLDGTSVLNAGARWKWAQQLDIVVLTVAIIKGTAIFKSYKWFANSNSCQLTPPQKKMLLL